MDLPPRTDSPRRTLARLTRLLLRPRPRYVLAWLLALGVAGTFGYWASIYFADPERGDGNSGHRSIDFGGQWLMGRMLVEGYGRHLYDRNYQRAVLLRFLPASDQSPKAKQSDVEGLMESFMGEDGPARPRVFASVPAPRAAPDAPTAAALCRAGADYWTADRISDLTAQRVGGPLYPPVNALYLYPLALLDPHPAYRIDQALNLVLAFACGLAVARLTGGWVWWPVASALIVLYPGFAGSLNLGQNATLSLTFVLWGWVLIRAGRPVGGGALWGLLAYKPVWAVSFFFALALARRWRAALAMLVTGAALALATLPLVGVESWFDWLHIGREAADLYNVSRMWIHLSRDLLSIPRRYLLDFTIEPARDRDTSWLAPVLGWGMLGAVAALTAALALWRRDQARATAGAPAAFVLLGAWLCCYHFMYYDSLLTVLPMFLLTAAPSRNLLRVTLVPLRRGGEEGPGVAFAVSNRVLSLGLVAVLIGIQLAAVYEQWGHAYGTPFDTFFLILVWLGCGLVWWRTPAPQAASSPVRFLLRRRTRYALAWLVALAAAAGFAHIAWNGFNKPQRPDGNDGHLGIDFGGQWLMGRMLLEGQGRYLYDRRHLFAVAKNHFPPEYEAPGQQESDVAEAMGGFMGTRAAERAAATAASFLAPLAAPNAPAAAALVAAARERWTPDRLRELSSRPVGGLLYPPVNALFTAPVALLEPHAGYRVAQALNLVLAFACGLAVSRLSRGAVWWPVAAALLLAFPGFAGSCNLGQNAALSLAILLWGWVLIAGGRAGWGGAVWGLLAYKPVWAASFFLALALTRRRRACLAMLATGAGLALATLPFVGLQSWLDWLHVGREAAAIYTYSEKWILLSRDLLGIPRRWLLDFTVRDPLVRAGGWLPAALGWGLLGAVAGTTAALALRRRDLARAVVGAPAAFLFLGAWLCCYHFMFYDALLAAFPVFLLAVGPRRPVLVAVPWLTNRVIGLALIVILVGIQLAVEVVKIGTVFDPPWDTFCCLAIWLGCGWVWLRTPAAAPEARPAAAAAALQPSPA